MDRRIVATLEADVEFVVVPPTEAAIDGQSLQSTIQRVN